MGDDGALLCESFDVIGFFFEERLRDEQREVCVDVSGRFEQIVQRALN